MAPPAPLAFSSSPPAGSALGTEAGRTGTWRPVASRSDGPPAGTFHDARGFSSRLMAASDLLPRRGPRPGPRKEAHSGGLSF